MGLVKKRVFKRTTIVAYGLCAFLVGLAISRFFEFEGRLLPVLAILCITPLLFRLTILSLLSVVLLGLILGIIRGSTFSEQLLPYRSLSGQKVIFIASATSDAVYGKRSQLEFDAGDIKVMSPSNQKLIGTIGVSGYGLNKVNSGDEVRLSGRLYLTRGSRQARVSFAKIEKLSTSQSRVLKIRRQFAAGLQSTLPQPLGSFGMGLLIGQRSSLPDYLNLQLSVVGLTHIIAVSGYNLTIMINLARRMSKNLSKYQTAVLITGLCAVFVMFTGFSASIVRASMVSGLSLLAWYYGRTFKPLLLILLTAALTAGWYPIYLWSDIGWHLSFLAFFGVLVVAPAIQNRFFRNKKPKIILQLFLETTSAQVMTLPLIMFVFGRLSLISLLANMLVVPLVPVAMLLSFVAGIFGMLTPHIAGWFSWPATYILTYMLDIVGILAGLPKASLMQAINVWQMIGCYLCIAGILFTWKFKKVTITDRKQLQSAGEEVPV